MNLPAPTRQKIEAAIASAEVVVFMKGNRRAPQCGFSATVVDILDRYLASYETVDVLADEDVREGVKTFSQWPTIPQIYLRGEFIGGCDILQEMHGSGELKSSFGDLVVEAKMPTVTLTQAAIQAVRDAVGAGEDAPPTHLRLRVNNQFYNDLSVEDPEPGDLTQAHGSVILVIDPASARLAEGVRIDFVEENGESGFKVDNPNAPPSLQTMTPEQLADRIEEGGVAHIVDVRTPPEREICAIEGSRLFEPSYEEELRALPKDTVIVFQCHHGMRSRVVAEGFAQQGFTQVYNLEGGIAAWAQQIEPTMDRY